MNDRRRFSLAVFAGTGIVSALAGYTLGWLLPLPWSVIIAWPISALVGVWAGRSVMRRIHAIPPTAPTGVRLTYADGTTSADLPVVYVGTFDGVHVWEAMAPDSRRPRAFSVAELPGWTVVRIAQ